MLYQVDCSKFKADTFIERTECLYLEINQIASKYENAVLIYGEAIAELFECWDSGPGPGFFPDLMIKDPRCGRGYYSKFFVCSLLKQNSVMIVCEKDEVPHVDAIEFLNMESMG